MNPSPETTSPICPLTHSTDVRFIFDVTDHSISNETFSVYENTTLPFRFTHPVPNESGIGRYYESDDYISHSNTTTGLTARLYQFVRKYTMGMKKRIVQKVTSQKHGLLLDYGCGTGEFASTMQQSGWKTSGIEPGEKARCYATNNYKLDVHTSLNDLSGSVQFDAITAWHVLEHVHSLHQTMADFHNILTEKGSLIVAVPNFQCFDAEYYKTCWAGYDVPRHLYHFSPTSMKKLAEKHNFEIVQIKRLWLDSFYVSLLSESYSTAFAPIQYARAFIIGLWSDLLALLNREKCSSLIYILKKR